MSISDKWKYIKTKVGTIGLDKHNIEKGNHVRIWFEGLPKGCTVAVYSSGQEILRGSTEIVIQLEKSQ